MRVLPKDHSNDFWSKPRSCFRVVRRFPFMIIDVKHDSSGGANLTPVANLNNLHRGQLADANAKCQSAMPCDFSK